jgi:hypothetical protein
MRLVLEVLGVPAAPATIPRSSRSFGQPQARLALFVSRELAQVVPVSGAVIN